MSMSASLKLVGLLANSDVCGMSFLGVQIMC